MDERYQFIADFKDGIKDCKEGNPADPNRSGWYQAAYAEQYEHEQQLTQHTKDQNEN